MTDIQSDTTINTVQIANWITIIDHSKASYVTSESEVHYDKH